MFSIVTFADSRISTSSGNSSSSLRSSCCRSGDGDRSLGSSLLRTCRSFCLLDNHLSPLHSTQGQNGIFGRPYAVRAVSTRVFQDSSVRTASFIRSMPHLHARMHRHLRQGCKLVRPHARLRMDDMCRPCGCSKQSSPCDQLSARVNTSLFLSTRRSSEVLRISV